MKRAFTFLTLLISFSLSAKKLFVSPGGNDLQPGTLSSPFATIQRAQQEALKFKNEAVTIYLLGGIYRIQSPIILNRAHTVIRAYSDKEVIIKGSVALKLEWSLYRNGIYKAILPKDIICDQLYVNDILQHMARYPNFNPRLKPYGGTNQDALSKDRVNTWADPSGGFVHAMHTGLWGGFSFEIKGKQPDGSLDMMGGWQNNRPSPMHNQFRMVENIFEELDTVGEWFFNQKNRVLYYKPGPATDMNKAVVEIPQLESLIKIQGEAKQPVSHVIIQNITLSHTLRTFMKTREPLLRSDWAFYRGAAIGFENTMHCRLVNCRISNLGGNAVVFNNKNNGSSVDSSHIYNIGANAISFVGNPKAVRSASFQYDHFIPLPKMDTVAGPKNDIFPFECSATDNLIHDIGLVEKQVAGIQISMSQRMKIKHNTIYDVPRAGINIGDGTWGGHEVAFNDVFNTVLETSDHGAINCWGRDRFWHPKRATMDTLVARHPKLIGLDAVETSRIYNNRFRCDNGWDIDLDDGSTNYYISNNICLAGGLKIREGFFRRIENNIILNNGLYSNVYFNRSGDSFKYNITSSAYIPFRKNDWGSNFNFNLFPDEAGLSLARKNSSDPESGFGDPQFYAASTGDYRVKPTSPAIKLGFKNFNMDFGTRIPVLQNLAKKVIIPKLITNQPSTDETYDFIGSKVKDLTTLSEQSATGMHTANGVLILEIPQSSVLFNQLLPNDVILEYAGIATNTVKNLYYAKAMYQYKKSVSAVIFRDQASKVINLTVK